MTCCWGHLAGFIGRRRQRAAAGAFGWRWATELRAPNLRADDAKGDPEFKKLVDEALVGLMKSGEFERIYARWFESPIPPKQINPAADGRRAQSS